MFLNFFSDQEIEKADQGLYQKVDEVDNKVITSEESSEDTEEE